MLRRILLVLMMLGFAVHEHTAHAQAISHSDVFFTYGETKIEIAPQNGRLVIPQVMPMGGFFAQANENPGFFSETDVGGGTGPNDIVAYNVLSDLMLWSDGHFATPLPDTEIRVINNPGTVEDTIIGASTGEQLASFDPLSNSIGQSSSGGEFHAHVDFRLEPLTDEPEEMPLFGAYGLKLNLTSDNVAIRDSDPFFIVYRFGIEDEEFSLALDAFDALLAETGGMLGDFDSDGLLTVADIDLLSAEVLTGSNVQSFDLTNDQLVDAADRATWVEELYGTHFGDADLDGSVHFADFLALSSSFGANGGWADGDFDGDGTVAFPDFLQLSSNFGLSGGVAASVPEPATMSWVVGFFAGAMCARRKRQP